MTPSIPLSPCHGCCRHLVLPRQWHTNQVEDVLNANTHTQHERRLRIVRATEKEDEWNKADSGNEEEKEEEGEGGGGAGEEEVSSLALVARGRVCLW